MYVQKWMNCLPGGMIIEIRVISSMIKQQKTRIYCSNESWMITIFLVVLLLFKVPKRSPIATCYVYHDPRCVRDVPGSDRLVCQCLPLCPLPALWPAVQHNKLLHHKQGLRQTSLFLGSRQGVGIGLDSVIENTKVNWPSL